MPIWNRSVEKMDRNEMRQLQLERLQTTVNRVYRNVPFYRRKFEQLNVVPEDVMSLDDLVKLPFTTKTDLCDGYPYEMFAVPLREIVRIHSSSAGAAKPIVAGYTKNDLKHWADLVARVMSAAGVTKDDVVHIAFDYGLFTGGFGMHYGAERLGASVIPVSSGNAERQIQIMQDFRSTALVATPSYALYMLELMERMGISPAALSLRVGLFGGEPMGERTRSEIESRLGIIATDNYGVSAVMGPGIAGECELKDGLHINEDNFLFEIVDPDTLEVLPEGAEGELVITTLAKEGLPMIRYRTRDVTRITAGRCKCGRTAARMEPVRKRTDDMIIVRGVSIYPSEIEKLLYDIEQVEPHYRIVLDRERGIDYLTLNVELSGQMISDQMQRLIELEETIKQRVRAVVGLTPRVKLVEPKTLRQVGPANRVVDRRED
ncbi:MAG: phenylacetate--CoA ligase [Armatimonadetes bacterium RBG_16_58_9]|nr:MAG: phenylacetate--CoA ligase [Armatimonadetes bacterium RBG_16_58_9]